MNWEVFLSGFIAGAFCIIFYVWLINKITAYNYEWDCVECDFRVSANEADSFDFALVHMVMPHLDTHAHNN